MTSRSYDLNQINNYQSSVTVMYKGKCSRSPGYDRGIRYKVWCVSLVLIWSCIQLIPRVETRSIGQHRDIDYHFDIRDDRGSIDSSTCLNRIDRELSLLFGSSSYPISDYNNQNDHGINFTCIWRFKTKSSTIAFKFDALDFPNCLESSIRLESTPSGSISKNVTTTKMITPSLTRHVYYSVTGSRITVIYQHASACRLHERNRFHITYDTRPHRRFRRDVSTVDRNHANASTRTSQKPQTALGHNAQPTQISPIATPGNGGEKESDSGNAWKIAVGVVVPIIIIAITLFAAYKIYRRKFPVRMILGREFSKFRNPNYQRPRSGLTLVREDAKWDETDMTNRMSADYNPDHQVTNLKIPYDNKGFEDDDDVDLNDESREDRDFRTKKSWLFRNKEDQSSQQNASSEDFSRDVSESGKSDDDAGRNERIEKTTKDERNEYSDDSDIEAMLQAQKVTPRLKRKNISGSDLSISSSSSEQVTEANALPSIESISSKTSLGEDNIESNDEIDGAIKRKSNFVEKVEPLFQETSVDEVRATLKARARSMSGSKYINLDRPRSCSLQIDPSKSARRGSCAANDSSVAENDLCRFAQMQGVTASVVGVAFLSESVREMYSSLSSVASNPHLVTDLDEEMSDKESYRNNQTEINNNDNDQKLSDKYSDDEDKIVISFNEAETNNSITGNESVNIDDKTEADSGDQLDQIKGDGVGEETSRSTSGSSSSSSDTHFEEHHVNMTKPRYNPQMSTVSAASDPTNSKHTNDTVKSDGEDSSTSGGLEIASSVKQGIDRETNNGLTETPGVGGIDLKPSAVMSTSDIVHEQPRQSNDEDKGQTGSQSEVEEMGAHKEITETNDYSNGLEVPCEGGEFPGRNRRETVENDDDDDDDDVDLALKAEISSSSYVSPDKDYDTNTVQGDDMRNTKTLRGVEVYDVINKDSTTQVVQEPYEVSKPKELDYIRVDEDYNNIDENQIPAENRDSHRNDSLGDGSMVENFSEPKGKSNPISDKNTKTSKDSELRLDSSNTGNLEGSQADNMTVRSNRVDKNELEGLNRGVSHSNSGSFSSDDLSYESHQNLPSNVRIISRLHISDASSDSSDVFDDESDGSIKVVQPNYPKTTRINTPMKKITFDLSNVLNDDIGDDDDDEKDDDDDNGNKNGSENSDQYNDDERRAESQREKAEEDNFSLQHSHEVNSSIRESLAEDPRTLEFPGWRDRGDTDGSQAIDVYTEFSDETIDNMLTPGNDSCVDNKDNGISNATGRRTIGIDSDVKFSFDTKSQIKIRDDEDSDDIDV